MALQEHLINGSDEIFKTIEDMVNNDEQYKLLDKEGACQQFFEIWLDQFEIANPTGDFFNDPENDDEALVCNIQSKLDFLLTTLEIFGLPKGYIDGAGHHTDWEQKKAAAGGRNKKKKAGGAGKKSTKLSKLQADLQSKKDELNKKPTYFDLEPIKKALKSFLNMTAESRSSMRTLFINHKQHLINCFKDQHDENSFKRCIDIKEIAPRLQQQNIPLDQQLADNLSAILLCFGDIDYEVAYGERVPPETDEQRKAKGKLELWRANMAKVVGDKGEKSLKKQLTVEEAEKKKAEEDAWTREEERLI